MVKEYQYCINCINSTGYLISKMQDDAVSVTYNTIRKHCLGFDEWAKDMGYDIGCQRGGLRLSQDWAVSFHRSKYRGKPCYYIRHSSIEYIWTKEE
jgi:hypothetical protein